jgi:predicted ATPase
LAEVLMGGPVTEVLANFLCKNAGGNPFFAQEIMAYWLEENQLGNRSEDTGVTQPSIFLLPNDVNSILLARLDRLDPRVKRTIQAAAVLGREFDLRVLRVMVDGEKDFDDLIRIGEEQCIWAPLSELRYQFRNVLLRNAAYEMQSRARLQDLHRRAAEAIETVYDEELAGNLAALGRHWQRAGNVEKARRYFLEGARKAAERYAHGESKRLYRAYFKLVNETTPESVFVRYELARDVLEAQGHHQEAMQEHFKVLDEAQKIGDRETEALGLLGLGRVHWATGRIEGARAFFEQALTASREAKSRWNEGLALSNLALLHKEQGRVELARVLYDQSLAIAREVGNRRDEGKILTSLANLYRDKGLVKEAVALQEQAKAIERELG